MSDLISRQDAINTALEFFVEFLGGAFHEDGQKILMKRMNELPSAKPERKKGEWVGDCCSCCGVSKYNYIKMVDDECGPFGTWNFCPHCGARLEWNDDE